MKHFIITLFFAVGILFSGVSFAATTLSDTELAGVSGGGIDPHIEGQSLPQQQQLPEKTPLLQPKSIDGMELAPELFVILQSKIDVERKRKLLLSGMTQQNAIALNLENVLSTDSVSTNNIFNGDSISVEDVTSEIEINQINDLSQRHRTQGNLTSSIASHKYEKSELNRSASESYNYHTYSSVDQNLINKYRSIYTRGNTVGLGERFTSLDDLVPDIIKDDQDGKDQLKWLKKMKFHVDELNHGAGADIKGSWELGSITDDEIGSLYIAAKAKINIKILFWTLVLDIDLFDVNKSYTVMDKITSTPVDPGVTQVEPIVQDDTLVEVYKAIDVAESSFNETFEHSIFTGGQMTGAEAELLALSDGSLTLDNKNTILLSENAQKNMRVFNSVNAVASVAANAMNMSRLPVMTGGASAVSHVSMQQHNRFIQQR